MPLPVELSRRLEQALLPAALLLLAFATLALGATPAWARAGVELAVLALLGLWLLGSVLGGEVRFELPGVALPLLAILVLAGVQAFAGLSVYAPATRQEFWVLIAVGGFFFLLVSQLSSSASREQFATGLLLFAFLLALFSVLQGLSFSGKIYWSWTAPRGSSPFGPFINRNHYAAWMLMVLPLAWMKVSQRARRREVRVFWALVLVALGISILFSRSRAGLLLFLLAYPLYAWLGRRRELPARRALAFGLGLVLLAGLATLALDTGAVIHRWQTLATLFSQPEPLDRYRWQMGRDTLALARDHLGLGSGLETFGVLSDSYRSFYSNQRWLQAHNDYLQWLAETGLVGAGLAVWFLAALGRAGREKLRQLNGAPRQLVAAALAGCLLALLHSLVDFPLRIPANALLFAALLALIAAPAAGQSDSRSA